MSYQALYRVWRPQRFEDIVGQEHVTQTLKNALKEGHLSHAYLFNGPRGTGKTSAAKILAKAVNCLQGPSSEPCNQCEACRRITEGSLMDVIEIDAASNRGVDEIRDLRDKVKYAPTEVRYKVYIIDEVHMLTTEAFNALLKTLEEPPKHVLFILATTEPHKLPATIISRCQRFTFRRIPFLKIVHHLQNICEAKQVSFTEQALFAIARAADGGMRDALSLLDQALAFGGDVLEEETVLSVTGSVSKSAMVALLQSIASEQTSAALQQLDELIVQGVEPEKIIQDLTHACRDLLLVKTAPQLEQSQGLVHDDEAHHQLSKQLSVQQLSEMLDILIHYQQQMKFVANHRILLEVVIVRLCQAFADFRLTKKDAEVIKRLEERIEQLEQTIEQLQKGSQQGKTFSQATTVSSDSNNSVSKGKVESSQPSSPLLHGEFIKKFSKEQLTRVKNVWGEILRQVKKERVTVHAWLIDGEPVAATDNMILVAFRTKIHRQTIEKPELKALVEKVMTRVLGSSYRLQTIMTHEWQHLQNNLTEQIPSPQTASSEKKTNHIQSEDDIVKRAIDLFGKELVEILE
ncbi:DNA polymerase-3 subunit gamma/tau [Thermoflavimicrobium dichotomicum]|uniref:DNA-directed DNA polymerase n=1 Tax=Thermoflavimicrobium dichotomicum TaxID=46223 RepID=A0A1I3KL11_9BACL|nr:DNA polymerase-3 subunit gamma/tau [Thermoflavimicrobium dichotomicum]